jgi:hypothetical protein
MSREQVILHSAFDPSAIQFSPVAKTSKGGKIVYVNLEGDVKVKVQTPILSAPFGISTFDEASTGTQTFSLDASFRGYDTDPKINAFLEKCRQVDKLLLTTATERSKEWLGKAMSADLVGELMRKQVRDASDPTKYAPTMRLKITPSTEFYDANQEQVDMSYIQKGSTFRAIISLSAVWFINRQVGLSWRIEQMHIITRPDKLAGFAFQEDEDA